MTHTRKRWFYAAGAAVTCAAVLVTANMAFASRNPSGLAAAAPPAAASAEPATEPSGEPAAEPATEPSTEPPAAPAGRIVSTGIKAGNGEWVLYSRPVKLDANPKITFGVMLGVSVRGAAPVDAVMLNETSGSDKSPGFHGIQGSMTIDQGRTPTFGYYAGPAAKITAKSGGRTVTAAQAPLDDSIQVFWFEEERVGKFAAYDADGKKLPTGDATVGVG